MKRKEVKTTLTLNRKVVSKLDAHEVSGGLSRGCSQTMCGSCSCPEACFDGPAPTRNDASMCICL